ncbi:MAG TPA: ATP-binding protein, partial [Candidatus Binataceae bacterium]|nr:ATP-binding protein [Candidatus Binataceae bacterium]
MTIRVRLTIYWAALLSLILLIAGVAAFLLFQRQQWGKLDGALMEEADTAAETVARDGLGSASQIISSLSRERDLGPARRVWIADRAGVIADAGSRSADLPTASDVEPPREILDGGARVFRYAIAPFNLNGRRLYIADGVDASAVRESIARLRTTLLLVLPVLLVVSVSIGYWLAGHALSPVNRLAAALAEIEPRDLSRRLPVPPIEDEIARLAHSINALLGRLERSSNAERRFAADAAHELRTPLAVLRSGIEVALGRDRAAGEYAEALRAALREAVALCAMADELLALTRLNQETALQREPVDLGALTTEVLEAIEPLAQSRHLALRANLDGAGAQVVGNSNDLRRVLINLLDNALKFTPENGEIDVSVATEAGRVIVRIADTGPGIPEIDLPFIFDRFFRGKARAEFGNGLGLSLCREIARLHDGDIAAANRPGGGAEFVVTL